MTILCLPEISDNAMNAAWGTMPGAGLRCSEPHRDTQDRTEHQGTGSIHCLECRFIEYQNNEYGCGVIGKVVNVTADESVMGDGKIDMSKVNAIAFDPYTHGYYKVTERVGEAFRDGLKLKK